MPNEPSQRVARVNKRELSEMPAGWTDRERGHYLRLLLGLKGIDPDHLYKVQYYPKQHCWIITQEPPPGPATPAGPPDDQFFARAIAEFRRTAWAAFAALASQSPHFAQFGREYQLPDKPEEMTPADLADLLGGSAEDTPLHFDSEGGWRFPPSEN